MEYAKMIEESGASIESRTYLTGHEWYLIEPETDPEGLPLKSASLADARREACILLGLAPEDAPAPA